MKHGYSPSIGISWHKMCPYDYPYYSVRIGLYWIIFQISKWNFTIMYNREVKFNISRKYKAKYKPKKSK